MIRSDLANYSGEICWELELIALLRRLVVEILWMMPNLLNIFCPIHGVFSAAAKSDVFLFNLDIVILSRSNI
jgi:hypothetical protein